MHPVSSHYTQQHPPSPSHPESPPQSHYTQSSNPPDYSPRSLHSPQTQQFGQPSPQQQEPAPFYPQAQTDPDSDPEGSNSSSRKRSQPESEGQAEPQSKRAKGKAKAATDGTTTSAGTYPHTFLVLFSYQKQRPSSTWLANFVHYFPGSSRRGYSAEKRSKAAQIAQQNGGYLRFLPCFVWLVARDPMASLPFLGSYSLPLFHHTSSMTFCDL